MTSPYPTYDSYQLESTTLSFEEMKEIHDNILSHSVLTNPEFIEIWHEIIQNSIQYTSTRASWSSLTVQQKLDRDTSRTSQHNMVLSGFIVLERLFRINSWDSSSWTRMLFLQDEIVNRSREDINDQRQRIGDFANYLTFVYALNNR